MTEHYDVERTITSLGIGEALVTVLSPKGIPTPLAATRLIPPDSRMAPLTDQELGQIVAVSPLQARYGTTVDRESAHEIISGRPRRRAGCGPGRGAAGGRDRTGWRGRRRSDRAVRRPDQARVRGPDPAPDPGRGTGAGAPATGGGARAEAREREARTAERQRQRTIETGLRTAGRVVTSRAGQSLLRGVFDTIFGGGRR